MEYEIFCYMTSVKVRALKCVYELLGTSSCKPVFKGEFYVMFVSFGIQVRHHITGSSKRGQLMG